MLLVCSQELIERQAVTAMQTGVAARSVQADILRHAASFAEYIRGMQSVHDGLLLFAQQGPAVSRQSLIANLGCVTCPSTLTLHDYTLE